MTGNVSPGRDGSAIVDGPIGFVGTGVMGKPMLLNLVKAGFDVVAFARRDDVRDELRSHGARLADDLGQLAATCTRIITMLPDSAAVESLVLDPGGVVDRARPGTLVIDMSTIDPSVSRRVDARCRESGLAALDAPVSGGDVAAVAGSLSIMVGGSAEDLARAQPLFDVLGSRTTHVGPSGAGQIVKACNQIVVGVVIGAVTEALVFGSQAGVDRAAILDALGGGLASNRVMEVRRQNFLERNYDPGFRIDLHHKDLAIALSEAEELGITLPFASSVQGMFEQLRIDGLGSSDHSAVLDLVERRAASAGEG